MEIQPFIASFDRWPEDGLVESSDGAGPDQAIGSIVSTRDGSLLSEGPLPLARNQENRIRNPSPYNIEVNAVVKVPLLLNSRSCWNHFSYGCHVFVTEQKTCSAQVRKRRGVQA
ncbi:hypothetical protein FCV25MIE_31241 [Fagus crenata]